MPIVYPDLSHYNWPLDMSLAKFAAFKATEGAGYADPHYHDYAIQAHRYGFPYVAYHFLLHGDIVQQAQHAYDAVGPAVPLMVDVEVPVKGAPSPTLQDLAHFVDAYRDLGGTVTLVYLPRWFWIDHWGSPALGSLVVRGLHLVASHYGGGVASSAGWAPYGGMSPAILQYTNSGSFGGRSVDLNYYPGDLTSLVSLVFGKGVDVTDTFFTEDGWRDVQYRLLALINMESASRGPSGGANALKAKLESLEAAIKANHVDPAALAALVDVKALGKAIVDEMITRAQGPKGTPASGGSA